MGIRIDVVSLKDPCSACNIIYGLIKEIMSKLKRKYSFLDINYIEIKDFKEIYSIEGLEVEKFPAIIINGEQFTAGTIPDIKELERIILKEIK
ncbi:MAG: thioredoxin family protein [bacterium]